MNIASDMNASKAEIAELGLSLEKHPHICAYLVYLHTKNIDCGIRIAESEYGIHADVCQPPPKYEDLAFPHTQIVPVGVGHDTETALRSLNEVLGKLVCSPEVLLGALLSGLEEMPDTSKLN